MVKRIFFGVTLLLAISTSADELVSLTEEPWLGFHWAYGSRDFDYGLTVQGEGSWIAKGRGKDGLERVSDSRYLPVRFLLEEKSGDRWVKRRQREGEYGMTHEASAELPASEVVMTYTGGSQLKVRHEVKDGAVHISLDWQKKPRQEARRGIEIRVPGDLYSLGTMDERELSKKLRGDRLSLEGVNGKRVRVDMDESIEEGVLKKLGGGIVGLVLETDKLFGQKMMVSLTKPENGVLEVEVGEALYKGFYIRWYPAEIEGEDLDAALVIKAR